MVHALHTTSTPTSTPTTTTTTTSTAPTTPVETEDTDAVDTPDLTGELASDSFTIAETLKNVRPLLDLQSLRRDSAPVEHLDRGETAARDAVRVDTSATRGERDQLANDLTSVDTKTKAAVDRTFERATDGKLPHGTTVTDKSDDRVELERRDNKGRLLWRESATREDGELHWERTDFKGGAADRKTLETGGDAGTLVRRETWRTPASRDPSAPTTEQLQSMAACDKSISVSEQSVRRDGDSLISREASWDKRGHNEVEKTYRTQTGSDGIHSTPAEDFDDDAETLVVETDSTEQAWGEEEKRTEQDEYSQGNLRATSLLQHDAGDDVDDDDDVKQWTLEKQEGDVYHAQTFVEDMPDVSTVTTRRAVGRTLHEEIEARSLDEDGEGVTATSTSDTHFDRRGVVMRKQSELVDETGIRTTQDFRRDEERTERGLEVREQTETTREEPGDPPAVYSSDRFVRSLAGAGSTELLSSRERITGPDGSATSVVDDRGPRLTVNGAPVPVAEGSKQLDRLSEGERDLAGQASVDTLRDVKRFGALGAGSLSLVAIGKGAGDAVYDTRLSPSTRAQVDARLDSFNQKLTARFGSERVSSAFRAQTAGLGAAKGIAGVAGLASAAFGLTNNIDQLNVQKAQAALDVGNAATGGSQGVAAVKEVNALKAGATMDEAAAAAGRFATFAKFGGVAVGVAGGGLEVVNGIRADDGVQIAQGGVTIAGAVGACAVAGSIGGPLGMAAGAGIGLAAYGIHEGIGALFGDDEPDVADKVI